MRHSHISPQNEGDCTHCGHTLSADVAVTPYGTRSTGRIGLAVTVLVHLLLIAIYFLQSNREKQAPPPAASTMVYIVPLPPGNPKNAPQQQQAPKKVPKTPPVPIQRVPKTITLPNEKPVEIVETPSKVTPPPPEMDMQAYVEARRLARGANDPSEQPAEESENTRATRIAAANIAAANGQKETGGAFSISHQTFNSADLKFRGWNPNFKRRWLQQLTVERGNEPDIETAIIKKMLELIRKEMTGDFEWDSHRLQRVVRLSARVEDTAELQAFLFKEMFPEYRPGPAGR